MKLLRQQTSTAHRQDGSVVFIFIVLLSLMMLFLAVNSGTLFRMHGEVRLIEKQQKERWNQTQTNSVMTSSIAK